MEDTGELAKGPVHSAGILAPCCTGSTGPRLDLSEVFDRGYSRSCPENPELPQRLSIVVLFTTIQRTLTAFKRAVQMSRGLNVEFRILIPQVVHYALPLDSPTTDPNVFVRPFLTDKEAIDMQIEVLLCRDVLTALLQALPPASLVLMGTRHRWWPTRDKSIARALRQAGHNVVLLAW